MSRRSRLTRLDTQVRAASRMTVGTRMWSEQPLSPENRHPDMMPPLDNPTIPILAWVGGFDWTIPDPPVFEGSVVISGVAVHAITGASADPTPPLGWGKAGGFHIGGSNRWSTGAHANVWAWGSGNNVRGGTISGFSWTPDRHAYLNGTVLYIYAKEGELRRRGRWSVVNGPFWTTSGAGALGQGRRSLELASSYPSGCKIGWQVGVVNSVYTGPSASAGVSFPNNVVGHYHRSHGGNGTDLSVYKTPGAGEAISWNYIGAYGSPAGASFAAGWFPT